MITPIQAYKDSSGALHADEASAARADAKWLLEKIFGRNNSCAVAVLENAHAIHEALEPIVALEPCTVAKPVPEIEANELNQELQTRYGGQS